jgi:hypothetical protein
MAQITIQTTFIWNNGIEKEAIYLNAYSIQDNLETSAQFYYQLLDVNDKSLIDGNISCTGDAYIQWLANDFATNWIMNYIASELNLTPITIN